MTFKGIASALLLLAIAVQAADLQINLSDFSWDLAPAGRRVQLLNTAGGTAGFSGAMDAQGQITFSNAAAGFYFLGIEGVPSLTLQVTKTSPLLRGSDLVIDGGFLRPIEREPRANWHPGGSINYLPLNPKYPKGTCVIDFEGPTFISGDLNLDTGNVVLTGTNVPPGFRLRGVRLSLSGASNAVYTLTWPSTWTPCYGLATNGSLTIGTNSSYAVSLWGSKGEVM